MPRNKKDANSYIDFLNKEPKLRLGGLNEEILNTGNLDVLKSFLENNKKTLNNDEKQYLALRIQAQEAFEKARVKSLESISAGEEQKLPAVDNNNGFAGFSSLKYPGKQTSFCGCWSCAFSLMLRSRGIDLTQEQIRAWRPDYEPNGGRNPASKESTYKRNGDTEVTMGDNADLITQLLPNTALSSITISPYTPEMIGLVDPNRQGVEIKPTPQQHRLIKEQYKKQAKKTLKDTLEQAVKVERSPVALLIDGHYVTVTGIAPDGKLRVQDSFKSPTEQFTTIDNVIHDAFDEHDKITYQGQHIRGVEPKGLEITYLRKIPVMEKENEPGKVNAYLGNEAKVMTVGDNGELVIDTRGADDYIKSGKKDQGILHSKGLSKTVKLDCTEIDGQLGGLKVGSFGYPGANFSQNETFFPEKVLLPGKRIEIQRPEVQNNNPARQNILAAGQNNVPARHDDLPARQNNAFARPNNAPVRQNVIPVPNEPQPEPQEKLVIDRMKLLNKLIEYKKGLDSTRLIGGGSEEMLTKLRDSVDKTIAALRDPDDAITDGGIMIKLDTIKVFSGFYMAEKRAEGAGNTSDPDWLPRSGMGKDRYKAARGLSHINIKDFMMKPKPKKNLLDEFEIVGDFVDIYANQRKMLWGIVGLADVENMSPEEKENFKDYVSMVLAQVLVVPQVYEIGKKPKPFEIIKEGEHAGKHKVQVFNEMVEKVKQREDFKEMIDGVKTPQQLKKLCLDALGHDPEKALVRRLHKIQAHRAELEAQQNRRRNSRRMTRRGTTRVPAQPQVPPARNNNP
ncbi:MAG: hypothetical protein K6F91_05840 [Ruminococcus sp.]|nr:hypothetical protein [Ruminococcus sp.]